MAVKIEKYFNEKNTIFFILLIAVIVLLSPCMLRLTDGNNTLIGDKAYYHARIAETTSTDGIIGYDELSYQGRTYIFKPYHLILSWLIFITDIETASQSLVFLCGIASVVLFFFILRELKIEIFKRALILFILILSPAFIYTFSVSNKHAIAVPFMLAGVYFLARRKLFFSSTFFIISAFLSFFNIIIALAFLLGEFFKKRNKKILLIIIGFLIILLIYYLPSYYTNLFFKKIDFIEISYFQQFISGLGSIIGFSIFSLLLAIIGLSATWKSKKKLIAIYSPMIILIMLSFFTIYSNIYLNFFICLFAGIGFYDLIKRKWEIGLIKDLVMLVLVCGLLFSSASYINRLVSMHPDNSIKESLEWLETYSNPNQAVLSHYSKGTFIEYWAKQPVVMDSVFEYAPKSNERYKDSAEIFSSRSLKTTKALLDKYNIKYIWLDNEMKNGLVWTEEKQGLLFLFRNKETFKNIYNKNNIEIWEVKEQE